MRLNLPSHSKQQADLLSDSESDLEKCLLSVAAAAAGLWDGCQVKASGLPP